MRCSRRRTPDGARKDRTPRDRRVREPASSQSIPARLRSRTATRRPPAPTVVWNPASLGVAAAPSGIVVLPYELAHPRSKRRLCPGDSAGSDRPATNRRIRRAREPRSASSSGHTNRARPGSLISARYRCTVAVMRDRGGKVGGRSLIEVVSEVAASVPGKETLVQRAGSAPAYATGDIQRKVDAPLWKFDPISMTVHRDAHAVVQRQDPPSTFAEQPPRTIFSGPLFPPRVVQLLEASVGADFVARLGLTGGRSPRAIHDAMTVQAGDLPWSKLQFTFGDERCVPPDHADSNFRIARESLRKKRT